PSTTPANSPTPSLVPERIAVDIIRRVSIAGAIAVGIGHGIEDDRVIRSGVIGLDAVVILIVRLIAERRGISPGAIHGPVAKRRGIVGGEPIISRIGTGNHAIAAINELRLANGCGTSQNQSCHQSIQINTHDSNLLSLPSPRILYPRFSPTFP